MTGYTDEQRFEWLEDAGRLCEACGHLRMRHVGCSDHVECCDEDDCDCQDFTAETKVTT